MEKDSFVKERNTKNKKKLPAIEGSENYIVLGLNSEIDAHF